MISSISSSSSQALNLLQNYASDTTTSTQKTDRAAKPPRPEDMFKTMDTNGDGSVTESEFETALKKMQENGAPPPPLPGGGPAPSAEEMFKKVDSNSDGQITLDELKADIESRAKHGPGGGASASSSSGMSSTDLTDLFKSLDTNSDGQIGKAEFKTLLEAMNTLRNQQASSTYDTGGTTSSTGDSSQIVGWA